MDETNTTKEQIMNTKLINDAVRLKLLKRVNRAEYAEALARCLTALDLPEHRQEREEYLKRVK